MRTPITLLLLATLTCASAQTGPEQLASRIAAQAVDELHLAHDGALDLSCRIVDLNQGAAGSGTALVMYSGPGAMLTAEMTLTERATGRVVAARTVHGTGRSGLEEAMAHVAERTAEAFGPHLATQVGAVVAVGR